MDSGRPFNLTHIPGSVTRTSSCPPEQVEKREQEPGGPFPDPFCCDPALTFAGDWAKDARMKTDHLHLELLLASV